MSTGIVSVGRIKYAVGLYWENSPSGHIAQAAKDSARQSSVPVGFYVTRSGSEQGRVPQFGLGQQNDEFYSGMPSLAGCLAVQQPGSWVGAFKCSDGYAVIIVRDDLIVPDGDLFFVAEGEARDRLLQETGIGGFQRTFAPESWGIPGADSMPISLLLNDVTTIKLRSIALSPKAKLSIAIVGGVLLIAAGVGFYIQSENEHKETMLRQQMAAMESARRAAQSLLPGGFGVKPDYPPPERKWEKHPHPMAVINACVNAMKQLPASMSGWRLTGLRCGEKTLGASWMRKRGYASLPPKGTVEDKGNMASRAITWDELPVRGNEVLVDQATVTDRYLTQNWTGSIRRGPDDPLPPAPPNYRGEWTPPFPPWVKRSFTLSVPVLPWTVPAFLADLPGVVIKSMTKSGGTKGRWTIVGDIYENRR